MGNRQPSVFVGQWAPTLLILGLYNKLVKQLGSDSPDSRVTAQRRTRWSQPLAPRFVDEERRCRAVTIRSM